MRAVVLIVLIFHVCANYGHSVHRPDKQKRSVGEAKIVGGSAVSIENYPYMAHLEVYTFSDLTATCAGTILSAKIVLTSARCLSGSTEVRITIGSKDIGGKLAYRSTDHTLHPNYDKDTQDYDAAIITTHLKLDGKTAKAIVLPKAGAKLAAKTIVEVLGWGSTSGSSNSAAVSKDLMAAKMPVVDFDTCKNIYKNQLTPRMFCAGDLARGGKDSCYNDGGGPAVIAGVQVGIVSWGGKGCGERGSPGVYTDVAAVRDWLAGVLGF